MNHAILLISCPDSKGITAAVTGFIATNSGNIIHADQHIDEQSNTFFMRIEWSLKGFHIKRENIVEVFGPIAQKFHMIWQLHFTDQKMRTAIFVSKHLHCLYDLLYRYRAGQLACEMVVIISNHPDAQNLAKDFKIKFHEFAVLKENKSEQEKKQMEILKQENIDVVVLARYHQILTPAFVNAYKNRIINIHHSFLPAFAGQNPYLQAYQRGVKLIGATSHYVTQALDEGPIIEQDTVRISHRDALEDLVRKGEDLEKVVLSRAVRWHLEKKILCYANKTVVFD
ncbi:MAG: formyltetrahydrofolate deformylase [Candidatus Omnitrophica bacterium]|nr:formyltetrahydrofolate deformylase [Candidatus Omnitrophota bacterium]